ncbi:MAG: UbiA family prenyltransferase [Candidatus Krumholzibacteriia bacterium]
MWLVDFFFALRPLVLVPAWSFFILGHGAARAGAGGVPFPGERFAVLSVLLCAVYLVNQVVDFESDRLNGKGLFLQRGVFTRRLYLGVAAGALAVGIGWAFARGESPLLLTAAAALGLAYSVPPVRLAARPGLDFLANATGYGALAFVLGAGEHALEGPGASRVIACMLAVGTVFLHTTLLDLQGDRRTSKRTSGVALGPQRTRAAAAFFGVGAAAAAALSQSGVLLAACAVVALLSVAAALRPENVHNRTVCVGSTALFALAASTYVPPFIACIALLAVLTRIYYRLRFTLGYPAL